MVVSSGEVQVDPQGQPSGTYLVLTLANTASDKVYINVGTLVDIYIAEQNAAKIQLSINQSIRVVFATIVAGSVGATELASSAVTTDKIANESVSYYKLAENIQNAISLAETSVQYVTEGSSNGCINVNGNQVAVGELQDAAYYSIDTIVEASVLAAQGLINEGVAEAKAYTDSALTWGTISAS